MIYRVAITQDLLGTALAFEAPGPAVAAARFVEDNNMRPGTYFVQEVPEPYEVEVTVERITEGKLQNQGGPAATVVEEVADE
jgi:hypothetical protein